MKITRLHLLILGTFLIILAVYFIKSHNQKKHLRQESVKVESAALSDNAGGPEFQDTGIGDGEERFKILAAQAIAVAGEAWIDAKNSGRDVANGQQMLREAKSEYSTGQFKKAWNTARESISELKNARIDGVYYMVKPGDTLWGIAKMPQHYGKGSMWARIWRANKKIIPDKNLIRPRQVLLVPRARKIIDQLVSAK